MSQVPLLSIYYVWQIAVCDTACLIGMVLISKLLEKNVCCMCKQCRMHDNHLRLRQGSPCHLDHAGEVTEKNFRVLVAAHFNSTTLPSYGNKLAQCCTDWSGSCVYAADMAFLVPACVDKANRKDSKGSQ